MKHKDFTKHNLEGRGRVNVNGYLAVYYPEHPAAWVNGVVYEHRLLMENHLGRYLEKDEIVHHLNENRSDNRIENLEITTLSKHCSHHTTKENLKRGHNIIEEKECKICGKKHKNRKYCSEECYRKSIESTARPPKEKLAVMVWEKPTTEIAKEYGVSDKAVEKWCKNYGLLKPPRGYWQKLIAGKP